MEAHIGEDRNEVEQHAEANGVGRKQLRIRQMSQHLPGRGAKPLRANEALFRRQQQREQDGADQRQPRERQEGATPADEIAQHAGNEAAAEAAEARSRDVDAGDAGHLRGRPLVADIGDGHREDRRQQQTLKEAPGDQCLHVRRQRGPRHGHHHR
jgi:hypothetical protein